SRGRRRASFCFPFRRESWGLPSRCRRAAPVEIGEHVRECLAELGNDGGSFGQVEENLAVESAGPAAVLALEREGDAVGGHLIRSPGVWRGQSRASRAPAADSPLPD